LTAGGAGTGDLKLVAAANRGLAKRWAGGVRAVPPFDADSVIAKAEDQEKGRLEPGQWEEALRVLTDDLSRAASLSPLGRVMAHGQLVGILRQRIRAGRLWTKHPEILERSIERPLIVLGQMRSGTTLTHRLLACDPLFSFTRLHETLYPMAKHRIAGRWQARLVGSLLRALNPQVRSAHPTSALAAEEEFGLHAFSLHGAMFEAQWNVPDYARWSEARDLDPVYREFHQLLQTLRWRRHDRADSIQLLKAPQFMQDLPAVLRQFPGARIVMLVRDLDDVMASSASLVWNQQRIQSESADPRLIGTEWRRKTLLRDERARRALEHVSSADLVTVEFEQLKADWLGQVRRIYGQFQLDLTPLTLARMKRIADATDHRGHHYSPAQFGFAQ
jgi:hypothetical protein